MRITLPEAEPFTCTLVPAERYVVVRQAGRIVDQAVPMRRNRPALARARSLWRAHPEDRVRVVQVLKMEDQVTTPVVWDSRLAAPPRRPGPKPAQPKSIAEVANQ